MSEEYRTDKECRYYASDLNKYIQKTFPRTFTCTNIDTGLLKIDAGKHTVRIIETKHSLEHISDAQGWFLQDLTKIAKVNNQNLNMPKMYIYRITGDYPFISVKIYDYITGETIVLNKKEFDQWIETKSNSDKMTDEFLKEI